MKTNRQEQLQTLFHNIELYLKDKDTNIISLTTDSNKLDINAFLGELVNIAKTDKKVLVLSYKELPSKVQGAEQLTLDARNDNYDEILEKTKEFDIVFVLCPNISEYNNYLHMLRFANTILLVVKRNSSKFKTLQLIKDRLQEKNANVLGIVYQE